MRVGGVPRRVAWISRLDGRIAVGVGTTAARTVDGMVDRSTWPGCLSRRGRICTRRRLPWGGELDGGLGLGAVQDSVDRAIADSRMAGTALAVVQVGRKRLVNDVPIADRPN